METKKGNLIDRAIGYFNPAAGARRQLLRAVSGSSRFATTLKNVASGGYWHDARTGRALQGWKTGGDDVNYVLSRSQEQLRNDSNALVNQNPIAAGVIQTKATSVIGAELRPQVSLNGKALGISDEAAAELSRKFEQEWALFAENADITRTMTMGELQTLAYTSPLVNGDVFVNLPIVSRAGVVYQTSVNLIEGHRVTNPQDQSDSDQMIMGVELDKYGAPYKYHVRTQHPGVNPAAQKPVEWKFLYAFDKQGRRQVLHIYKKLRVNQVRGAPMLAPVIDALKKLDTWSQAVIDNAVISAFFTVFVKSDLPGDGILDAVTYLGDETGATVADKDLKLASGNIVRLYKGEDVTFADPSQPNENFEPFFRAVTTQIAVALNMPVEVLLKLFNASYSASRGALLEAAKHYTVERNWIVGAFCQPVYEWMLFEAVTKGWLDAPGFLTDPRIQRLYSECTWIGPAEGSLNPLDEARAREIDIKNGVTNEYIEAAGQGRDFEQVNAGRARANNLREEAGLNPEIVQNPVASAKDGSGNPKPADKQEDQDAE